MRHQHIALIGGSGFVGRHLTHHLRNAGYRCRVITRHAFRHPGLRLSAEVREAAPHDRDALAAALDGCDAVVNLAGILNPAPGEGFRRAA